MPISQSPNGNQTINPVDLKTVKYSIKQQNFNLNGKYPWNNLIKTRPSIIARIEPCYYKSFIKKSRDIKVCNYVYTTTLFDA